MSRILWSAGAVVAGTLIVWIVGRLVMSRVPDFSDGETTPSTHLQRAARWSLILAGTPVLAVALILAVFGLERATEATGIRFALYGLIVASLPAAGGGAWWVARRGRAHAGGIVLDERDRAILERAPAVQSITTILVLAAWTVLLTERFSSVGAVPLAWLQIVFWSCVMVNALGLPAGVLMGYRKA
jgi:hypothetical protein